MNTSTCRLLGGLVTAAVLLLGPGVSVRAASPSPAASLIPSGPSGTEMLSIQPSLIDVSAKPGTTTTTTLTLRAAAPLDITIQTHGLAQSSDGGLKAVPDSLDTSAYSARRMIKASLDSLHVKPGDTVKLNVEVAIPADAGDGTRYAILTISGLPTGGSTGANVGFGVELGVSAIVQIAGTPQVRTGEVQNIAVGKSLPGAPLPVDVSFFNTGNTHYGAAPDELVTTSTLQDASGAMLATASVPGTQTSVVPAFTRDIALSMTPSKPLVEGGAYHVEVGVGLKDGTVFDRKALDFTWSGGAVIAPTSAPVLAPPAVSSPATSPDPLPMLAAGLLGAALVGLFVLIVSRSRRRPGSDEGSTSL